MVKILNAACCPMTPAIAFRASVMAEGYARKARAHIVQKEMWINQAVNTCVALETEDSVTLFPDVHAFEVTFAGIPFYTDNTMSMHHVELLDKDDNVLVRIEALPTPSGYGS